jgi:hypothetical protein
MKAPTLETTKGPLPFRQQTQRRVHSGSTSFLQPHFIQETSESQDTNRRNINYPKDSSPIEHTPNHGPPTLRRRQSRPRHNTALPPTHLPPLQPAPRPPRVLRRPARRRKRQHGILRDPATRHPTVQPRTLSMVRLHAGTTHIYPHERAPRRCWRRSRLAAHVQAHLPGHARADGRGREGQMDRQAAWFGGCGRTGRGYGG